ncbi:MAG: hypothetical protein RBS77_05640, partial [Candidatus Moranbacteria bacterium]|nr:hypothetical protein [Candidatus Moranbacteria bacterium]
MKILNFRRRSVQKNRQLLPSYLMFLKSVIMVVAVLGLFGMHKTVYAASVPVVVTNAVTNLSTNSGYGNGAVI